MDGDESDENMSSLEKTLQDTSTNIVLTLDYVEVEIEKCLKEKHVLKQVFDKLEEKFSRKLSDLDCSRVEDKYIDLLTNLWLDESLQIVSSRFDPKRPLKYIEILNDVNSFSDCNKLFGATGTYNDLIYNLSKISSSFKCREKEFICELKKICCNQILNCTADTKNEMDFVKNFSTALKSFKDINLLCQLLQVDLILKHPDEKGLKLLFSNLLGIEIPCPKFHKLNNSIKKICNKEKYFFIGDLRDMIVEYLKPVVIRESNADGRLLLEVSGKHIVVSHVREQIEISRSFSHIEEVRFVGAGVIHIDADLSSTLWHGKNIVIYGETLIVREDKCVTWDVSGMDADFTAIREAAGTSADGCGLKGEDGSPGESGGNVCILVETIENCMNFKIISNGGKGSKGQNGGSGRDGKDGEHIDVPSFKKDFPPVSHIKNKRMNYMKTMDSVCKNLQSVEKVYYGLSELNIDNTDFEEVVKGNENLNNIYFETTTKEGCKIKFSFYNEGFFTCCQSFLLHKGALGTEGKVGGGGGFGGKGGFAGDVKVQTAKDMNLFSLERATNGADGEMGKSGKTGNPGKSGVDGGYMDCTLSIVHSVFSSVKWPKVFIPNPGNNNRLTVKFYDKSQSDRVKSPHNGKYAEITQIERKYHNTLQLSQRIGLDGVHKNNDRPNHHEICANRKKTISQKSIVVRYKGKDSIWNNYNIENALEKVQSEMEELIDETLKETEKLTQDAKITRQVSHNQNDWYLEEIKYENKLENKALNKEIKDKVSSSSDKPDMLSWFKYTLLPSSYNKNIIKNVVSSAVRSGFSTSVVESIPVPEPQSDSLDKYHLDNLEHMYVSISFDHILEKQFNIKSQVTNTRFLNETENVVSDVNKEISCLEKLFCEDSILCRQEVVRILSDYSLNDEALQEAFNCFIYEFENEKKIEDVIKLIKHESNFNQFKELRLKEKLLPLKKELLTAYNNNLYKYLLIGILQQNNESKLKFENEISQNPFLSYLYRSFVFEMKKSCDWEIEGLETGLLVFEEYIKDRGPFASSFRELLAQHYNVNILVYTLKQETNTLVLVSNHNPKATSEIHFLLKRNKFVKLQFDYEFARLFEQYKHLGNALTKIMFHFCSFTDKKQISNYIENAPFTSDDYGGLASSLIVGIKINHVLNQDNYVKTICNSYLSEDEDDIILVKCRLDKLNIKYIGYQNILHYMALHFEVEGSQICASELCFVINQILKFSIEESEVMSLVSWIIAAQPQKTWVLELTLLKLELYLKSPLKHEMKLRWREYIEAETEKNRLITFLKKLDCETCQINVDGMDELLYLIGSVPNAHIGLENINLSDWKYYLKDRFWAHHMTSITNWSLEQLKILSFYLVTWENSVGKEQCLKLVNIFKERSDEIKTEADKDFLLTILKGLNSKDMCFSTTLWSLMDESSVKEWKKVIDKESVNTVSERPLQQLVNLIQNSGNTCRNILNNIPSIESTIELSNVAGISLTEDLSEDKLKRLFLTFLNPNNSKNSVLLKIKNFLAELTPDESTFDKALKVLIDIMRPCTQFSSFENVTKPLVRNLNGDKSYDQCTFDLSNQNIVLPLIELCVRLKHKKRLRNTQKIAVMTFLTNAKNTLAQVSTGEGKSLIVVTVAIIKALSNEKVNIVTSSKVLAKRDAEMYRDIYEMCGLTVGHNCSENIEERKKVYSNCQVIYGDLANFQRDYLLDRVYNKNILGDCTFGTVIVDEVDSMLLDKGNNVLYLSHDIPGLDKIEPVFIYIWKWVSRPIPSDKFEDLFSIQAIKENIMYEIFGVIYKKNIKQLDTSMTEKQVDMTWEWLIQNKVIDPIGKVLIKSVNCCEFDRLPESCVPKIHLNYILKKVINRERILNIPLYLHSFVEDHLESWIKSGVSAMVMESGRDYIVDVDRSETVSDRNPIITILDRDTGTDLVNSQWDEALHQFLQLKHGCKLSLLNLKAVFISNVSYLKLFKTIYGLTGTLGSTCEREVLQKVYDVDFVTIPTAKAKKFSEEPSILCSSTEEWKQNVYKEVFKILCKKRSALIICETIKDVYLLREKLSSHFEPKLIHTYTRDYERFNVAGSLQPGNIIISTNLAGRGTDIKLSPQLINNGGLYVCLTFLPSNYRVEEQAYGRAARNGEPGSAQLIFRTSRIFASSNTAAQIIDVKKQRDINELKRLADIKSYHDTQIKHEEKWFGIFRKAYETLRGMDQKEEIKDILHQAFLNQWAFWLDKNKKHLILTSNVQEICSSLDHFISDWTNLGSGNLKDWLKLIGDPTQLVKLGLAYLKIGDMPSSLLLLDKVIEEEPYFSEIALYYRVCVITQKQDLKNTGILEPLKVTAKKLKVKAELSQMSALEINWLKERDHVNLIQTDAFLEQQKNITKIYEVFLQSIYSILGNEILPESFVVPGLIEKQLAKDIYNNVMKGDLLTKPKIRPNIQIEDLLFVKNYGLSPNNMNIFISQFKGKEYKEQQFLESFKEDCLISSRETFWEELVNNQVLANEEIYVFIDMEKLRGFHPSFWHWIKPKIAEQGLMSKNKLWLYNPEEFSQIKDCNTLFMKKDELLELIGPDMYELLDKKDMFILNKMATFVSSTDPLLEHFDSISKEDFQMIDICEETACLIIEDLTNQHIIKNKSSKHPGVYCLLTHAENIEQIELTTLKAYTYEVKSLMSVCFAFRIAFEKLKLLTLKTCENVCLPLPVNLYEKIVFELKENEIIEKAYVDVVKQKTCVDVQKIINSLYPTNLNTDGYKKILQEVCYGIRCDLAINLLIKNKWLLKTNGLSKPQNDTYYINPRIKSLMFPKPNDKVDDNNQPKSLPDEYSSIMKAIVNHLLLIEHLGHVKNILTSSRGQYLLFETPSFSLNPLLDVLLEKNLASEIEIFALNGFDQLIVLEEKKWTWRTKCNILTIVVMGVCQIAVGSVLETYFPLNPLGMKLIAEGINDLIFAVSCIISGHCSFQDYLLNKVISLVTTCSKPLFMGIRSKFGQKASGISFQSIKQKATNVFGQLSKSCTLGTVSKKCSIKIVTAISHGLVYATADYVIESQIEEISLAITEALDANISETVDDHCIAMHLKEMYSRYGPTDSKKTINVCFLKHIGNFKDIFSTRLSTTVGVFHILIRECWRQFPRNTNETPVWDYLEIYKLCGNVVKAIKEGQLLFNNLIKEINNFLDMVGEDLRITVQRDEENGLYKSSVSTTEKDFDLFISLVHDDWKSQIKNQLSDCLSRNLLSPVSQFVTNQILRSSTKFFLNKSKTILRNDDVRKQNVSSYKHTQAEIKLKCNSHTAGESEYEKCLLDLLEKKRNVAIFTEILRKNVSVDTNFIEMCCFVLPKALKSEGVVLPNLEIVVERNGTCTRFSTTDKKCEKTSIIIAPDSDFVTNVFKNKTLIKNGVDLVLTKIFQDNPVLSGYPMHCLKSIVAEKIEICFGSQPTFPTIDFDLPYANNYFKLNATVEHKFPYQHSHIDPYQHSHIDGQYVFNIKVDVDLRKEEKISSLILIEDQVLKGFICALNKINSHIHKVQDHLRNFRLSLDDFEKKNYQIFPQTNKAIKGNFHCFASHYTLEMPFVVDFNKMSLENFTISMTLKNQVREKKPYSPGGPHITYKISPSERFEYLEKGIKGNVLINEECADYSFSVKDCHVAGELILPTGFQLQKTCRVLMLGDTMFEAVSEVSSYPNFVAISYVNFNAMKYGISHLKMLYKVIQCVVLIPGISTSLSKMSGGEITANISEALGDIQGQFGKTKLVLCSLYKGRGVSVGKITQTNKCLKIHCNKMNVELLDTNKIISPEDLDENGTHLNKRGLNKILLCVS